MHVRTLNCSLPLWRGKEERGGGGEERRKRREERKGVDDVRDLTAPPSRRTVNPNFMDLKLELENQARKADMLVLWLDCDREGEAIADEVREICCKANRRLDRLVFRAKFSAVLPNEIHRALHTLGR